MSASRTAYRHHPFRQPSNMLHVLCLPASVAKLQEHSQSTKESEVSAATATAASAAADEPEPEANMEPPVETEIPIGQSLARLITIRNRKFPGLAPSKWQDENCFSSSFSEGKIETLLEPEGGKLLVRKFTTKVSMLQLASLG
jgi:hypothetical protein